MEDRKIYRYHFWLLLAVFELLAFWLLYACAIFDSGVRSVCSILLLVCGAAMVLYGYLKERKEQQILQDTWHDIRLKLDVLPRSVQQRLAWVLVSGEKVSPQSALRISDDVLYIPVEKPANLATLVQKLTMYRQGIAPDAMLLSILPAQAEPEVLSAVMAWRAALAGTAKHIKHNIPLYLMIRANLQFGGDPHEALRVWHGFSVNGYALATEQDVADAIEQYQRLAAGNPVQMDLSAQFRQARVDALLQWCKTRVLPVMFDTRKTMLPQLAVQGVSVLASTASEAPQSEWGKFCAQTTQLQLKPRPGSADRINTLPSAWLYGIKGSKTLHLSFRTLCYAVALFFGALALAFIASAHNNARLYDRIARDLGQYQKLTVAQDAARLNSLNVLKEDLRELRQYQDEGVPTRLGFGLYRAHAFIPGLEQTIRNYRPPQKPTAITLDSLSLFDSGQYTLKEGANKALINALDMIRQNPQRQILIEGHTDNTGGASANMELSEQRARAVRDWLVASSDIPVTQFAIKGYGDTQPVADNETESGRAKNRRVEIVLIPAENLR